MTQFAFEITWYNEFTSEELTEFGVTVAESYKSALEFIIDDYGGEESIVNIKITSLDEGYTVSLSEDAYKELVHEP